MKTKVDEFVWTQKYRPQTVEDAILPIKIKEQFIAFRDKGNIPDLILAGNAGVGKTTLAKAICNELGIDYLFLQGSGEDRGIDTVKNKVGKFATSVSWDGGNKRKMVIYDEADNLTGDAQLALRSVIEANSDNCGFILTCNFPGRLLDALISRCHVIDLKIPKNEMKPLAMDFIRRLIFILKSEGINEYDTEVLKTLVVKYFPDMRRIINAIQHYSAVGSIDSGILDYIKKSDSTELIKYLKDKEWNKMRKWVGENVDDAMEIILDLYHNGHKYFVMSTFPQAVIFLDEAQTTMASAVDKELKLVATLTKIMSEAEFQ
jgi:DNA polymerase III delta prime subunit